MDITRSSLLSTVLYSALLVVLFWSGETSMADIRPISPEIIGARWSLFDGWELSESYAWVKSLFGASLMFLISLMVARTAIKHVFYLERTYMPSVIYVLLASAININTETVQPLLAAFFVTLSITYGLKSYRIKSVATSIFVSSAFYMGVAVLIYPPTLYISPVLLLILSMYRLPDVREWLSTVVIFCFTIGFYWLIQWAMDVDLATRWGDFLRAITLNNGTIERTFRLENLNVFQILLSGVCTLLFVLAVLQFMRTRWKFKRYTILGFNFFAVFALWAIAIMIFSPVRQLSLIPIAAIPLSVVIPTFFAFSRATFFSNFIYALLLLSAVAIHLVGYLQ